VYDVFVVSRSNLFIVAVVLAFFAAGRDFPQESSQILDRPFPYDVFDRTEGPLPAISELLRSNGLSGGVVLTSDFCDTAPPVHWWAKQDSPFRQVLNDFQASNPDYHWELRGDVLNLVPATGVPPLLAAKVRDFDLDTTDQKLPYPPVRSLLDLPEIRKAATELHLKEGTYYGGPMAVWNGRGQKPPPKPIDVHIKNASLQDSLNAIAQAYGHTMWWYERRVCGGEETYTVSSQRD